MFHTPLYNSIYCFYFNIKFINLQYFLTNFSNDIDFGTLVWYNDAK